MERAQDVVMRTVTRELLATWRQLDRQLFGSTLRPPTIEIVDQAKLGEHHGTLRRLRLSWSMIMDAPWGAVIEVLKHEMAHQYVHDVLGVRGETAHGPTFRRVCEDRGIDWRAAGLPETGEDEEPAVVRRARKLLALAESPNEHEARTAMKLAMRLMTEHGMDLATREVSSRYVARQIGRISSRRARHEQLLSVLLTDHFGVAGIWVTAFDVVSGRRGRVLEIVGTPSHVAVAEYVHAYVLEVSERLWRQHQRARGIRSNRERRAFLEGVIMGLRAKLDVAGDDLVEEGLVKIDDPQLLVWFMRRHPSRRAGRRVSITQGAAHMAGRKAGQTIAIRKAVKSGQAAGLRKLTGPRRGS